MHRDRRATFVPFAVKGFSSPTENLTAKDAKNAAKVAKQIVLGCGVLIFVSGISPDMPERHT
jgi:hypothetical protein